MRILYFSIVIVFIVCIISESVCFNLPQVKLLNVIFRHGDRKPFDDVNGDLTNVGRLKAYKLGETLRTRYGDFLGDFYDPSAISARSTGYSRAKMSLQLLLAGLYVPHEHQIWHKSLAWQPIPFSFTPRENDILLFPKYCPRFERELARIEATSEFKKLFDPYREMIKKLENSTGEEMKSSNSMFLLYNKLSAMEAMNQTLPDWANEFYPNGLLLDGAFLWYDILKYTDWMRKIHGGTLIRKVADDMLNKTDEEFANKKKLFLYSGHELNIVAVLQTLKLWDRHIPEYSSAIVIELREDRKNYYVKILYFKGTPAIFKEIQIPGCPSFCPLSRFIELISDQLPDHNEIICDNEIVNLNKLSTF